MTIPNDILTPSLQRLRKILVRGAYSASDGELVACQSLAAAIAVAIPAPGNAGRCIAVGDEDGNAATNNVTVAPSAGLIDGAANLVISRNGGVEMLLDDGTQWRRVQRVRFLYDPRSGQTVAFVELASMIAGSSGDFGASDIVTTGSALLGPTPRAAVGRVRMAKSLAETMLAWRHDADIADHVALAKDAQGRLYIGATSVGTNRATHVHLDPSSGAFFGVAGNQLVELDSLNLYVRNGFPLHIGHSSQAATGMVRRRNNEEDCIRNAGNSADVLLALLDASNYLRIGDNAGNTKSSDRTYLRANNVVLLGVQGDDYCHLDSQEEMHRVPIVGYDLKSSPYGVHGVVSHAMADANYTVTAAQYKYDKLIFTGALTAGRTVTFPAPSSDARGYKKIVENLTGQTLTISTGAGSTRTVVNTNAREFQFSAGGVTVLTAGIVP